jgi:predicted tellurium resistance membrane protein TerC
LLSVAMMGLAANYIARVINRYRWIAYIGLLVILVVAVKMIYEGWVGTGETLGIISLLG